MTAGRRGVVRGGTLGLLLCVVGGCTEVVTSSTEPEFVLDTAELDFGDVPVSDGSPPLPFTISNDGEAELEFFVGAINSLSTAFSFQGEAVVGDHTLAPGDDVSFSVVFEPVETGEQEGSIRVDPKNDPDPEAGRTVILLGNGV